MPAKSSLRGGDTNGRTYERCARSLIADGHPLCPSSLVRRMQRRRDASSRDGTQFLVHGRPEVLGGVRDASMGMRRDAIRTRRCSPQAIEPTVEGVLGGFGSVSPADLRESDAFITRVGSRPRDPIATRSSGRESLYVLWSADMRNPRAHARCGDVHRDR
jgi:hypothetical protein